MKNLGVSFALAVAFAALAHGLNTVYSPDCTVCPDCVNEVHTNYSYPIPDDICSLCLCENGTPEKVRCQRGFKYDGTKGKCVHDDTGLCSPCCDDCCKSMCPPCYHGIATPIPNPKNKCWYCLCDSDGSIKQKQCPRGFRYNDDTKDCDIPDPDCGQCPDVVCTGGDHELHFADKNSEDNCDFCCCKPHDLQPYIKRCPWGEKFLGGTCDESTRGQCKPTRSAEYVLADDCGDVVCPSDPDTAPLYPDPNDEHYFCQCDWGGVAHQFPCPPNTIFNFKQQTCVPENRQTRKVLAGDCADVVCPSDPETAPLYPDPNDEHYYCVCDWDGVAHQFACPPNTIFNFKQQTCVPENRLTRKVLADDCANVVCPIGPSTVPLYPDPNDEHYFCICDWDGVAHKFPCRPNLIFNFEQQTCVPENRLSRKVLAGDCADVVCPSDPETAPLYPDPNDEHYFCMCDWGGVASPLPCPPDTIFNFEQQTCVPENRL